MDLLIWNFNCIKCYTQMSIAFNLLFAGGSTYNLEEYPGLFSFDVVGDLGAYKENSGSAYLEYTLCWWKRR